MISTVESLMTNSDPVISRDGVNGLIGGNLQQPFVASPFLFSRQCETK